MNELKTVLELYGNKMKKKSIKLQRLKKYKNKILYCKNNKMEYYSNVYHIKNDEWFSTKIINNKIIQYNLTHNKILKIYLLYTNEAKYNIYYLDVDKYKCYENKNITITKKIANKLLSYINYIINYKSYDIYIVYKLNKIYFIKYRTIREYMRFFYNYKFNI